MKIAVIVLSACLLVMTVVAAVLWRDNALLSQQLATSKLITPTQMASVAEACHDLVYTNRKCLAFSKRVKEMLDVEEGSPQEAVWAGLWGDDQVRRGTGGPDQRGSGR